MFNRRAPFINRTGSSIEVNCVLFCLAWLREGKRRLIVQF